MKINCEFSIEHIFQQLDSIKEFPASIRIYDRALTITNKDEMFCFKHGIEVGWGIGLDENETT